MHFNYYFIKVRGKINALDVTVLMLCSSEANMSVPSRSLEHVGLVWTLRCVMLNHFRMLFLNTFPNRAIPWTVMQFLNASTNTRFYLDAVHALVCAVMLLNTDLHGEVSTPRIFAASLAVHPEKTTRNLSRQTTPQLLLGCERRLVAKCWQSFHVVSADLVTSSRQ